MLLAVSLPPPEAADAIRRAWDGGVAVAPLDPSAPEAERQRALSVMRPTHLLDGAGQRQMGGGAPIHPDVAAVVTTSGTTRDPRAVELTWAGLRASAAAVDAALASRREERWLCCLPLHHVAGLAVLGRAWASGHPVTVLGRFDVGEVAAREADLVSLVPTQVLRLVRAGADLSRFRRILVGGAAVPEAVSALPNVVTTYGLTETWGGVVHDGRPLPGVDLDIAADGEVLVRSPTVMREYRLDPAATSAVFTAAGWLRTGDVGVWAPDGRLHIVDRRRDLIVTGGVNVSPAEVESALSRHPEVADVAVAGAADEEWGQRVVAYVVPTDRERPPTVDALREFARSHLATPKLPREVVLVDAIPRTDSGKPLRRLLSSKSPLAADEPPRF